MLSVNGSCKYDGEVFGVREGQPWMARDVEYCADCGEFRSQREVRRTEGFVIDVIVGGVEGWIFLCNSLCLVRKRVRVARVNKWLSADKLSRVSHLLTYFPARPWQLSWWERRSSRLQLMDLESSLTLEVLQHRTLYKYLRRELLQLEGEAAHDNNPFFADCQCTECIDSSSSDSDSGNGGDDHNGDDKDEGDSDDAPKSRSNSGSSYVGVYRAYAMAPHNPGCACSGCPPRERVERKCTTGLEEVSLARTRKGATGSEGESLARTSFPGVVSPGKLTVVLTREKLGKWVLVPYERGRDQRLLPRLASKIGV